MSCETLTLRFSSDGETSPTRSLIRPRQSQDSVQAPFLAEEAYPIILRALLDTDLHNGDGDGEQRICLSEDNIARIASAASGALFGLDDPVFSQFLIVPRVECAISVLLWRVRVNSTCADGQSGVELPSVPVRVLASSLAGLLDNTKLYASSKHVPFPTTQAPVQKTKHVPPRLTPNHTPVLQHLALPTPTTARTHSDPGLSPPFPRRPVLSLSRPMTPPDSAGTDSTSGLNTDSCNTPTAESFLSPTTPTSAPAYASSKRPGLPRVKFRPPPIITRTAPSRVIPRHSQSASAVTLTFAAAGLSGCEVTPLAYKPAQSSSIHDDQIEDEKEESPRAPSPVPPSPAPAKQPRRVPSPKPRAPSPAKRVLKKAPPTKVRPKSIVRSPSPTKVQVRAMWAPSPAEAHFRTPSPTKLAPPVRSRSLIASKVPSSSSVDEIPPPPSPRGQLKAPSPIVRSRSLNGAQTPMEHSPSPSPVPQLPIVRSPSPQSRPASSLRSPSSNLLRSPASSMFRASSASGFGSPKSISVNELKSGVESGAPVTPKARRTRSRSTSPSRSGLSPSPSPNPNRNVPSPSPNALRTRAQLGASPGATSLSTVPSSLSPFPESDSEPEFEFGEKGEDEEDLTITSKLKMAQAQGHSLGIGFPSRGGAGTPTRTPPRTNAGTPTRGMTASPSRLSTSTRQTYTLGVPMTQLTSVGGGGGVSESEAESLPFPASTSTLSLPGDVSLPELVSPFSAPLELNSSSSSSSPSPWLGNNLRDSELESDALLTDSISPFGPVTPVDPVSRPGMHSRSDSMAGIGAGGGSANGSRRSSPTRPAGVEAKPPMPVFMLAAGVVHSSNGLANMVPSGHVRMGSNGVAGVGLGLGGVGVGVQGPGVGAGAGVGAGVSAPSSSSGSSGPSPVFPPQKPSYGRLASDTSVESASVAGPVLKHARMEEAGLVIEEDVGVFMVKDEAEAEAMAHTSEVGVGAGRARVQTGVGVGVGRLRGGSVAAGKGGRADVGGQAKAKVDSGIRTSAESGARARVDSTRSRVDSVRARVDSGVRSKVDSGLTRSGSAHSTSRPRVDTTRTRVDSTTRPRVDSAVQSRVDSGLRRKPVPSSSESPTTNSPATPNSVSRSPSTASARRFVVRKPSAEINGRRTPMGRKASAASMRKSSTSSLRSSTATTRTPATTASPPGVRKTSRTTSFSSVTSNPRSVKSTGGTSTARSRSISMGREPATGAATPKAGTPRASISTPRTSLSSARSTGLPRASASVTSPRTSTSSPKTPALPRTSGAPPKPNGATPKPNGASPRPQVPPARPQRSALRPNPRNSVLLAGVPTEGTPVSMVSTLPETPTTAPASLAPSPPRSRTTSFEIVSPQAEPMPRPVPSGNRKTSWKPPPVTRASTLPAMPIAPPPPIQARAAARVPVPVPFPIPESADEGAEGNGGLKVPETPKGLKRTLSVSSAARRLVNRARGTSPAPPVPSLPDTDASSVEKPVEKEAPRPARSLSRLAFAALMPKRSGGASGAAEAKAALAQAKAREVAEAKAKAKAAAEEAKLRAKVEAEEAKAARVAAKLKKGKGAEEKDEQPRGLGRRFGSVSRKSKGGL